MSKLTDRADRLKRQVSLIEVFERLGEQFSGTSLSKWRRGTVQSSLVVNTHANTWARYKYPDQHGDIFDLVMMLEGCTFPEAVELVERGDYVRLRPLLHAPTIPLPQPPSSPELEPDLHLRYHRALDAAARQWWYAQGVDDEIISRFFLGACDYHPIWRQPTYTIPVIVGGRLVNVRHRLAQPPTTGDKYRPERAGLPTELFNSDILTANLGGVVIVAGEKKVLVLARRGLPAISSTAGCGHWRDEWTTRLQFCRKVYIAFDPGEGEAAVKLAERIGERAWVVNLPEKPDDFILRIERERGFAAAEQTFRAYLSRARAHVNSDIWLSRNGGKSTWGKMRDLPR